MKNQTRIFSVFLFILSNIAFAQNVGHTGGGPDTDNEIVVKKECEELVKSVGSTHLDIFRFYKKNRFENVG